MERGGIQGKVERAWSACHRKTKRFESGWHHCVSNTRLALRKLHDSTGIGETICEGRKTTQEETKSTDAKPASGCQAFRISKGYDAIPGRNEHDIAAFLLRATPAHCGSRSFKFPRRAHGTRPLTGDHFGKGIQMNVSEKKTSCLGRVRHTVQQT